MATILWRAFVLSAFVLTACSRLAGPDVAGFELAIHPAEATVQVGGETSLSIQLMPAPGFTGELVLFVDGLSSVLPASPPQTVRLEGAEVSTVLLLKTGSEAPVGTFEGEVVAVSGALKKTAPLKLKLVSKETDIANFSLSIRPERVTVSAGETAEVVVVLERMGGFNGSVELTAVDAPSGVSVAPVAIPADGHRATLILAAETTAASTESEMRLLATSGAITHAAPLKINVLGAPSPLGLDRSFGKEGMAEVKNIEQFDAQAIAVRANGRILLAGEKGLSNPLLSVLIQVTAKGELDPTFNSGAPMVLPMFTWISDIQPLEDGRFIVTGALGNKGQLTRHLADGKPDPSFGNGSGGVTPPGFQIWQARALADGRIVVAGIETSPDLSLVVARYTNAGVLDASFGDSGVFRKWVAGKFAFLELLPDGKILTVSAQSEMGSTDLAVIRLTPDGVLDPLFGKNGTAWIGDPALDEKPSLAWVNSEGAVWVLLEGAQDEVLKVKPDGTLDTQFGRSGRTLLPANRATALAVNSKGEAYITRTNILPNATICLAILRLTAAGAEDKEWQTAPLGSGHEICDPDVIQYAGPLDLDQRGYPVAAGARFDALKSSVPSSATLFRFVP